jgi:predicted Fe-S protein YdhL (DUF1289 family)
MSLETPCTSVCQIDPRSHLCFGCGRTIAEIAGWSGLTGAERRAIMAQLPERMAAAGLALVSPRGESGPR